MSAEPRTLNTEPITFQSAFARARRAHKDHLAEFDRAIAAEEARVRPTEFTARLREDAARQRLTLTPYEKRVLHEDRRLYARQPLSNDPDAFKYHLKDLARRLHAEPAQILRTLDRIDRVLLRAELLGISVDTRPVRRIRPVSRRRASMWTRPLLVPALAPSHEKLENSNEANGPLTLRHAPHHRCARFRIKKHPKPPQITANRPGIVSATYDVPHFGLPRRT
jgi:hypothetical protein